MTRLRHYHMGCGESLQSSLSELQRLLERTYCTLSRSRLNAVTKTKRAKPH